MKEMCEEEESYLNSFYRDCFAELVFPFGHSHMRTESFVEALSRESFAWVFDAEQLRGRFMNMARAPVVHAYTATPVVEAGDDLARQVRDARHVVEQDKRIVATSAGGHTALRASNNTRGSRRSDSSSSSSSSADSGRRRQGGFDHLSTIQSQPQHIDLDS